MFQQLNYNPAYAGQNYGVNVQTFARFQYVDVPGAPLTQAIALDIPLPRLNSGLGVHFSNDVLGAESNIKFSLDYAYRLNFSKYSSLAFGASAGIFQKSLDGAALLSPDGNYELLIDHQDTFIPQADASSMIPSFSLGAYFVSGEFDLGLSVQQLFTAESVLTTDLGESRITAKPHFYLYSGYKFDIFNNFMLFPSLLVKSDMIIFQSDIALTAYYQDKYFLGTGLRGYNADSFDALVLLLGIKLLDHMTVSYSYDLLLSSLSEVSSGSHELSFSASLKNLLPRAGSKIIFNPRNL